MVSQGSIHPNSQERASATLLSRTQSLRSPNQREQRWKRDTVITAPCSVCTSQLLLRFLPSSPSPHPPLPVPSPHHGAVWSMFISQGVTRRAKRLKYEKFCCLHPFLQQTPTRDSETQMIKHHQSGAHTTRLPASVSPWLLSLPLPMPC